MNDTVSDTNFPGDGYKMTGDIAWDSDISSYPDRVFYTDTNNTNNTTWNTFSHIQGTVALNKSKPRTCNVITLSATTDSGTLKKSETYTYYVKKGADFYRVGKADTDTVSWMPMDAGSYQVYVMVKDKWGIEKIASSPVVVQVK